MNNSPRRINEEAGYSLVEGKEETKDEASSSVPPSHPDGEQSGLTEIPPVEPKRTKPVKKPFFTKEERQNLSLGLALAIIIIIPFVWVFYHYDVIGARLTYHSDSACVEDSYVTYSSFQRHMQQKGPHANFSVLMWGDSILHNPIKDYDMLGMIQDKLHYNRSKFMVTFGVNGSASNELAGFVEFMPDALKNTSYDAVIIYWDSDISNFSMQDVYSISYQKNYRKLVRELIRGFQSFNITYIALSGPGILGEVPAFTDKYYRNRRFILDLYRGFNQKISKDFNIPYINMRKALLHSIPLTQSFRATGTVSQDGEHPNHRGAVIESSLFAAQINKWMQT